MLVYRVTTAATATKRGVTAVRAPARGRRGLQAEGAPLNRERIHGVYGTSHVRVDSLLERFLFEGFTQAGTAVQHLIGWVIPQTCRCSVLGDDGRRGQAPSGCAAIRTWGDVGKPTTMS